MWKADARSEDSERSRVRLVDMGSGSAVTNIDDMRSSAANNKLGLCNFTYGPINQTAMYVNGSEEKLGWTTSSDDDCDWLLVLDPSPQNVVAHGYISPVIVLLTLVTNSLVCAVLLQRHMRTPTNIFLLALAVSDALTGAVPLPVFMHFYTFGAYHSILVPEAWCPVYQTLHLHLPTTWHTASIWLTVGLAFQRYVYVCHQTVAKRLCTVRNAAVSVGAIYVAAIVSQLSCNFEYRYEPVSRTVTLSDVDGEDSEAGSINITGCYSVPLLAHYRNIYYSTYWYFRITFIHLIPCVLLVALNARLFVAMRRAQAHRSRLLSQNRHSECRRLAETNMATLMLLVVVGVFLLVEVPLAVIMITMIIENTFDPLLLMDPDVRATATVFINLIILFSYPVNFFIYCGMSHQFRETFCRLFAGHLGPVTPSSLHTTRSNVEHENDGETLAALRVCEATTAMSDFYMDNDCAGKDETNDAVALTSSL